jgi:hypothetical protein
MYAGPSHNGRAGQDDNHLSCNNVAGLRVLDGMERIMQPKVRRSNPAFKEVQRLPMLGELALGKGKSNEACLTDTVTRAGSSVGSTFLDPLPGMASAVVG